MSEKAMEAFLKHKELMDEAENIGEDYYALEFRKLRDESDRLKSDPTYSTKDGEKPCNLVKNRYKDILPFDYNRVKLKEASEADNDYINASFIKGIGNQCYIAAQGPLPKTVNDFWSVIWDYNVRVVIMACQEYEGYPAKLKCFRYWNQDLTEELVFGKITVKMLAESFLPDTNRAVVKRTLAVRKNNGETRTVIQIHHTRWPDKFIPTCVDSILALLKQTREYHAEDRIEPALFHCSAGCGRTGSLIVIDYVWSMLKKEKISDEFSLFEVILEMRKQRMAMVQSLDQYQFVYGAVEKLFLGEYTPPLPQKGTLHTGVGRTSSTNTSREGLSTVVHLGSTSCQDLRNLGGWTWDSDKSGELRDKSDNLKNDPFYSTSEGDKPCNLEKNRYKDILPFDYNRVKLKETSESDNDYINASFIKGVGNESYIAAQGPLPKTVSDFWSVIWDYNVKFVVMACREYEGCPAKLKCFRYWCQDKTEELVFGKITVKMVDESFLPETNEAVVKRTLTVQKNYGETRTIIQIHHTMWPDKFVPARVDSILALLKQTREFRNEPVLFHCSAGCGRTGTLIVTDYIWSMLKKDGIHEKFSLHEVIFEMRKQRMAVVQSLDQYHFVYEAVAKLFQIECLGPKPMIPSKKNVINKKISDPPPPPKNEPLSVDNDVYLNESEVKDNIILNKNANNKYPSLPNHKGEIYPDVERYALKMSDSDGTRFKKATGYMYLGHDIGFPNRIPKVQGPRTKKW